MKKRLLKKHTKSIQYFYRKNKFVFFTVIFAFSAITINTIIYNSINAVFQSLLLSYIASVFLFFLVEVSPNRKKTEKIRLFTDNYYSGLFVTVSNIINHLLMAAGINPNNFKVEDIQQIKVFNFFSTLYYIMAIRMNHKEKVHKNGQYRV